MGGVIATRPSLEDRRIETRSWHGGCEVRSRLLHGLVRESGKKTREGMVEMHSCNGFILKYAGSPLLGLASLLPGQAELAQSKPEDKSPGDLRIYWNNGLRFGSSDKNFKFSFGGRIMNDWAFLAEDRSVRAAIGDLEDGTEFRRARLYLAGTLHKRIAFKAQYDHAGGDADFKDVWIAVKGIPHLGTFQAGHFKERFGLEELTSSKYITFMERALTNTFVPSRNTGFGLSDHVLDERMTWALGVSRTTGGFGDVKEEGGFNVTARVTGIPWQEGEDRFLHVGLGFSQRSAPGGSLGFKHRPEAHLAPDFVSTGPISADGERLVGAELAVVHGPLSVQAEYMSALVDSATGSNPGFSGYYAMASWFPTGEHRAYKRSAGVFSRMKPAKPFLAPDEGWGAWEVALRYSHVDLEDALVTGGELSDITLGVNWYLTPNARVMWNYVRADLDRVGNADIFQMRLQIDF
ncbi:MAG: OprO/OprP family phosphate-selective porin [Planctomycetota bacterium]